MGEDRVMVYQDREIICLDCQRSFLFTVGEQAFYEERGLAEPKRCHACRAARRQQQPR